LNSIYPHNLPDRLKPPFRSRNISPRKKTLFGKVEHDHYEAVDIKHSSKRRANQGGSIDDHYLQYHHAYMHIFSYVHDIL